MEGENISPPASTAANVGHGEPTKDVLNTHYILERQVNRKAKLCPRSTAYLAGTGVQISLQEHEGKSAEGGNAAPSCGRWLQAAAHKGLCCA